MLMNNSRIISDIILRLNKTTLTWTEVGRMRYPRTRHQGSIIQMTKELQDICQDPRSEEFSLNNILRALDNFFEYVGISVLNWS